MNYKRGDVVIWSNFFRMAPFSIPRYASLKYIVVNVTRARRLSGLHMT